MSSNSYTLSLWSTPALISTSESFPANEIYEPGLAIVVDKYEYSYKIFVNEKLGWVDFWDIVEV